MPNVLRVPLRVRLPCRDIALDLVVRDDAALLEIDEEELPGLQPALAQDALRRVVEHTRLGGEHDPAVVGLVPTSGTEPVAVERRADHASVGERDRRRAVPRLHEALVVRVEAAQLLRRLRLRDHHHQRVRDGAAGEHEQLEHVVEHRRVGARRTDDGEHLAQVVPEELRGELRLARPHPVDVAAQRVDLAVVRDHPVRVGQLPARERVRGEAGVHEGERALEALVAQVGIETRELRRGQHPLVDERPRGQARDHELGPGGELGHAPDDVQLPFEGVALEPVRAHDELADARHRGARRPADVGVVEGDVAPADQLLALGGDRNLDGLAALAEAGANAVFACRRQPLADLPAEERIRDLDEDPGAVARVGIRAGGAPVLEVREGDERPLHRLVARHAVQPRDERDAAGVVLEGRVIQTGLTVRQGHLRVGEKGFRLVG